MLGGCLFSPLTRFPLGGGFAFLGSGRTFGDFELLSHFECGGFDAVGFLHRCDGGAVTSGDGGECLISLDCVVNGSSARAF